MSVRELIFIGIALAMDALGVTLSIGLNPIVRRNTKIKYIISFGFFQFLFFLLDGVFGYLFDTYVVSIPNLVGGLAIGAVGIMMFKEGFESEKKEDDLLLKKSMPIILGVSVSIDALVVGFTACHHIGSYILMTVNSIMIGLITLLICTTGFFLCRYIRRLEFITRYADFLGGLILIIFAIKMIFF